MLSITPISGMTLTTLIVAAVILVGILGWKLAALYVAAGLLVAWFGGLVMQWFRPERWVESYVWKIRMGETMQVEADTSLPGRHRYAVGEVKEIVGRIWTWVLLGIGVGAFIHGYVPTDVIVDIGVPLRAIVTPGSVDELGLAGGGDVVAAVKASAIRVVAQ